MTMSRCLLSLLALSLVVNSLALANVSGEAEQLPSNHIMSNEQSTKPEPRGTSDEKTTAQVAIIFVDVYVSAEGNAIKVTKSAGEVIKPFDQLAIARAKKMKYPIRQVDGQSVEYWCRRVAIEFNVTPHAAM